MEIGFTERWGDPAFHNPEGKRMKFILLVVAAALSVFTGCSTGTYPMPQSTVTATVTVTAPAPEPSETTPEKLSNKEVDKTFRSSRIKWANDPNRAVLFKDYGKAAVLVAHALADGKFGRVEKYNEQKTDLMPGQVGWGGIAVNSGGDATPDKAGAFAWVYYRANSSIDWSKGVKDFAIDMGPKYYGLMYSTEDIFDRKVKHWVSLDVKRDSVTQSYNTCFRTCLEKDDDNFIHTRDLYLLAQVETNAAKALDANMTALYGPNWRMRKP